MADEDNKAESESPSEGDSGGKNPLILIVLILNLVALGVVAYFQYNFMKMEAEKPDLTALLKELKDDNPEASEEQKIVEVIKKERLVELDSFTVNLAQTEGPQRFARLSAVLKVSEESKLEEFEARKPQIRDTVISILNSKRPEDLLKKEGKTYLKEEFKSAINSFLIDGKVEDIFYISFQIN